jgi:uncharacterized membrane protein YeiB
MNRIVGLDIARAFAIIGMILVNFKVVFGGEKNHILTKIVEVFEGKAAATFVFLAGVGISLGYTSSLRKLQSKSKYNKKIIKRALLLFVIGLSYLWLWPADILHYYGIYMILTLFFIDKSNKTILFVAVTLITLFPMLLLFINYEADWDFSSMTYTTFWTLKGFFKNLFYNGFHPVIPWLAFMLLGFWFGKQNLKNIVYLKRVTIITFLLLILVEVLCKIIVTLNPSESTTLLFSSSPMPPMPMYMISGLLSAFFIVSFCILLENRFKESKLLQLFQNIGKLALTFYVLHVIFGMGAVELFSETPYGEYSIVFSFWYGVLFCLIAALFSFFWFKKYKTGPLEYLFKKIIK